MLNNDIIMASICHNSTANFIHGFDMKARQWRKTWWSSDAIFTRDCSFSSSLYARLERTENPSFSSKNRVSSACFWRFSQPNWTHKKRPAPLTAPRVLKRAPGHWGPVRSCELSALHTESVFVVSNESPLAQLSQHSLNPFFSSPRRKKK